MVTRGLAYRMSFLYKETEDTCTEGASHQREGMRKRGASSTWQGVQSLPGHGNGLGGRQQNISLVPAEGDEGHLVPACIRLP